MKHGQLGRTFLCALSILALSGTATASEEHIKLETRCGWFSNPTPANMWLSDRDGEWLIGAMGGHQAEGDWDWPQFKESEWVKTNRSYGYGCACFKAKVDKQTREVLFIEKAWARPLAACEREPYLKRPFEPVPHAPNN